jgi:ketosteroid isomerase-like protein
MCDVRGAGGKDPRMRPAPSIPVVLLVFVTALPAAAPDEALRSLVEAERAFARLSVEAGQRPAFLANFADQGIGFQPEPVKMKELLGARPPGPPLVLDWEPWVADVATSGDLGYTTGPWMRKPESAPARYGWYFTVWRRPPDGPWRVVADIGITSPSAGALRPHAIAAAAPPAGRATMGPRAAVDREALLQLDRDLTDRAARGTIATAFRQLAANGIRVYREGLAPMASAAEAARFFDRQPARAVWRPLFGDVARSGDLGYTYGSFTFTPTARGAAPASGFYLRVWTRQRAGWRIAADIANEK